MAPGGNGYCGFLGTFHYSIILGAVEHLLWTSFNFPFGFTHVHVGSIDTAFVLIQWTKTIDFCRVLYLDSTGIFQEKESCSYMKE